ncbi:MAG: isoprenylcysteine carboxylmethyltransferase family protein [Candidatus Eisenbacteria bacterium]|nr:isoprenylcysteine carboxylmethyltransferase family protein [Candidatus Eisenbacteria bacterium]
MTRIPLKQALGIPLNVAAFVLLMALAWGDPRAFFAHPVRLAMTALLVVSAPVMTLCTGGRSRGVRHAPDHREFFPLLVSHTLFTAVALPWMDARGLWVLPGGDALRWAGLVVFAAGMVWRLGPMIELGPRFVSVVALREGHRLHTGGFYHAVRHPSYLGIFLMDVGFAGIFRSPLALLLLPLVFWMFQRRMDVEERFLLGQFGDAYRDYMARTARVLPGVW